MSKTIIITGASRGIGKAIAEKFASANYNLSIVSRNNNRLNDVTKELEPSGANVISFCGDVSEPEFANSVVNATLDKFGNIDILVNNAGVARFVSFLDSNLDMFKEQIDTNLYGVYNFTKAVIDTFLKNNKGTIINISSVAGKNGFVGGTMYAASKHALNGFSKSLMLELRNKNIKVVTVSPGSVNTDMIEPFKSEKSKTETILEPETIANAVFNIAEMPENALVTDLEIRPLNPEM